MIHMAMVKDVMYGKTMRKSYAKYEEILQIPNMLKIQKDSYQWFLEEGLREVFKDVGTITDFSGKLELSFLDYSMNDKPKYTIEECKERDATYAKPIKVRVRLRNTETEEIKEQDIFMGDFPIMTNGGTFVINGAERVIVSQIVRSPGMYYGHEVDKADQHTKTLGKTFLEIRGNSNAVFADGQRIGFLVVSVNGGDFGVSDGESNVSVVNNRTREQSTARGKPTVIFFCGEVQRVVAFYLIESFIKGHRLGNVYHKYHLNFLDFAFIVL